ncbi:hypothetical protein TrST_g8701 [Triparma strigata]|uniref:Neurotransmitter-gated ion-channel ligand-binding domain-containing protein n=1 Tax=Triparma strigata TaxID=1606541 RepID=A0A9W7DQR3_9STRA|nr:hypothetical protein TrST_g8701 [Triparma strigata]
MSQEDTLIGSDHIEVAVKDEATPPEKPYDDPIPRSIIDKNRPTIKLGMKIRKIKDVDYVMGSFTMSCMLLFEWHDPKNVGKPKGTFVGSEMAERLAYSGEEFSPCPRFENAIGEMKFDSDQCLRPVTVDNKGKTKLQITCTGQFWKEMELHDYPLDVQLLNMDIRFPHSFDKTVIERLPMDEEGNCVSLDEELTLLEYSLRQPYICLKYPQTVKQGKAQAAKPMFRVVVPVQRAHMHYVFHIGTVCGILTLTNAICFLVPPDDVASRCDITLTLFLTIVATKFLVGERLPQLPFLTIIDVYFMGSWLFFVLVLLESSAMRLCLIRDYLTESEAERMDALFAVLWLALWVVFNIIICLRIGGIVAKHESEQPPVLMKAGELARRARRKVKKRN